MSRASWLLVLTAFAVGCATKDIDSESHFLCYRDSDCMMDVGSAVCVAGKCQISDAGRDGTSRLDGGRGSREAASSDGAGGVTGTGGGSGTGGASGTGGVMAATAGTLDAGSVPLSCHGLAKTCGAFSNESCCTSLLVTGGTFDRGYDGVTFLDQRFPATVSDFQLDKYEVTIGRFLNFNDAWNGGWRPSAGAGKHTHLNGGSGLANSGASGFEPGWDATWTASVDLSIVNSAGTDEHVPLVSANWYTQYAFCIWDGGFLPSEAEWNYAAAGGGEQRVYPWSSPPTSTAFNDTLVASCGGCLQIQEVGTKPAGNGKYGQSDLAGNVWEYVLDGYVAPYVAACVDCAYLPPSPAARVSRGGAIFPGGASGTAASVRNQSAPTFTVGVLGARCARSPL
jgi:formylglycine-generating enzyme required for sulfatase activity